LTDRGVTSVQFLLAGALGLIVFLALANLVVVQYGRGVVRSAVEQGARVGAVTGSQERCQARVDEVLGQLMGGRMGDRVSVVCVLGPAGVVVSARAVFATWTPMTPDYQFEMTSRATLENHEG
jgi:hypothetical protein